MEETDSNQKNINANLSLWKVLYRTALVGGVLGSSIDMRLIHNLKICGPLICWLLIRQKRIGKVCAKALRQEAL